MHDNVATLAPAAIGASRMAVTGKNRNTSQMTPITQPNRSQGECCGWVGGWPVMKSESCDMALLIVRGGEWPVGPAVGRAWRAVRGPWVGRGQPRRPECAAPGQAVPPAGRPGPDAPSPGFRYCRE